MDKVLLGYAVKSGVVACMLYLGNTLAWQHQITQCALMLLFAALTWKSASSKP